MRIVAVSRLSCVTLARSGTRPPAGGQANRPCTGLAGGVALGMRGDRDRSSCRQAKGARDVASVCGQLRRVCSFVVIHRVLGTVRASPVRAARPGSRCEEPARRPAGRAFLPVMSVNARASTGWHTSSGYILNNCFFLKITAFMQGCRRHVPRRGDPASASRPGAAASRPGTSVPYARSVSRGLARLYLCV